MLQQLQISVLGIQNELRGLRQEQQQLQNLVEGIQNQVTDLQKSCVFPISIHIALKLIV